MKSFSLSFLLTFLLTGIFVYNVNSQVVGTPYIWMGGCNLTTAPAPVLSATTISYVCPAVSVNLTSLVKSTAPAGAEVTWWYTNASGVLVQVTTPTAVSGDIYAQGNNFYAYYTLINRPNDVCRSKAHATVFANVRPILNATSITNVCPAKTVDLTKLVAASAPPGSEVTWWYRSSVSEIQVPNPTAVDGTLKGGIYVAYYTEIGDPNGSCYSQTSDVTVTVTITVPVTPAALVCEPGATTTTGASVSSTSTGGTGGAVTWNITPTSGVIQTSGSGLSTGAIIFNNVGVYTLTYISSNSSGGCTSSTTCSKTITVNNPSPCTTPSFSFTQGITATGIINTPIGLNIANLSPVSSSVQWSIVSVISGSGAVLSATTGANISVSSATPTVVVVRATATNSSPTPCIAATTSNDITVTITNPPCSIPTVSCPTLTAVVSAVSGNLNFTPTSTGANTFSWTISVPAGGAANPASGTSQKVTSTLTGTGIYSISYTVNNNNSPVNCVGPKSVTCNTPITVNPATFACSGAIFGSFRVLSRTLQSTTTSQICGTTSTFGFDRVQVSYQANDCGSCHNSNVFVNGQWLGTECAGNTVTVAGGGNLNFSGQGGTKGGFICQVFSTPYQAQFNWRGCTLDYEDTQGYTEPREGFIQITGIRDNYVVNSQSIISSITIPANYVTLNSVTVSAPSPYVLNVGFPAGVSLSGNGTSTLFISGANTPAVYQAILQSMTISAPGGITANTNLNPQLTISSTGLCK